MKKTTFSIILVCSLLFGFGYQGISQAYMVKRGERPTIDLNQVPKEAYEHNTIIIKLAESQDKAIETLTHSSGKQAVALFGIAQVDQLNMQYAVQSVMPHFATNATVSKFTERHKAWGFHRWFKLDLEESDDIVSIVMAYRSLPEVEWAEPVYKKRLIAPVGEEVLITAEADPKGAEWFPNDPRFNEQWHYHNTGQQGGTAGRDIDLPEAWEIETGNSDVIVAVIDEGVQYTHPELAGNMWDGIGFNFVNNTSNVVPGNHGTHVAGTIAAENDNNLGVSGIAGGTGSGDGVRIMSCQVFQGYSNGGFHIAPVWAADNGASISQNSWGYSYAGTFEQSVLDAIDYFNANGGGDALDGGITIFAAGNDDSQGQWYPGCYSGAFAIAATNNQDKRSWYSNYDTWVDISAPGGETNTVTERGVLSTLTSNSYGFYQGTSMACPHASGVAALMISMAYGLLSNEDVAEILRTTTDDHYDVNPSYIGKLGTGRLNALNALLETQNYLTGVTNPRSFKATGISTNTIELEWNLNPDNNNVLILWSADDTFGELQDGTTYNVGQTINGGGIVLYKGNNTEYTHNGLEANTKYFYKAFSFNAENTYSSGKITYAWTQCDILTELPYFQDFNESASLPNCWDVQDNQGNGQVWAFGTISGGLTGTTGNYAYLDSDGFGSGNTQNTDLISPLFDLSEYMEVEIEFKHYFRSYSNNVVSFHYSIDGGNTWTQVESWSATTSNPANFTVTIDELTGQSNVLLKWNYTGSWGYYWCVDDVSITGESNIPGAPTTVTNPNPSNNAVNVATDGQLSWSWGNNTNKYDLWFGTANNMQLVVSQADAGSQGTTGSYSYSNLQTNTIYQWQLVSYNTNIGMEKNGPVWSFRTEFDVINPPYFEDFEAEFPPLGWTIYDVDGSPNVRTWEVSTAQNHTPGGNRSAFHNYGPSSQIEDGWLVTPKLALPANSGINLSFWNYNTFPSWYEKNSVLISAGDGTPQTGNFVELWSPASITSAWTETNIDLSVYAGQEVYIAFRYQGSNAHAWHVDDVEFSLTVAEPVININPMQLNETLSTGQTSVKQLTVSNTGAADLEFQIEVTTEQKNIRLLPVIQQDYSKAPIHFDWSSIEFQKANKQSNNSAPTHITDEEIIRYDNGINDDAIGLTNGGTFEVAAYWPASTMAQYVNMQLEKVEVYINDVPSSAVIKIYGQGTSSSPGALLYSQSFSSTPDTWITVELDTPVGITGSDIWIGYEVTHDAGQFPAGCDAGPAVVGYGDMIALGGAWDPISVIAGFDVNWNIAGYLVEDSGPVGEWLSASPLSGTLTTGQSLTIDVSFDAYGLPTGTYSGSLVFSSNDPTNPVVEVPVTLEVSATAAVITLDPESLVFSVPEAGSQNLTLTIGNTGDAGLDWSATIQYLTQLTTAAISVPEGPEPVTQADVSFALAGTQSGGAAATHQSRETVILHYDGENNDAIGLEGGGSAYIAARFPSDMVSIYAGYTLESVDIYIHDVPTNCIQYIWGAGTSTTPGEILHQQSFTATGYSWNTITLSSPVTLSGQDIWVGYSGTHEDQQFPAGCDAGPANPQGDWISVDGINWIHLSSFGFSNNWNIRALINSGSDFNWLSFSPTTGSVAAGSTQDVTVTADAADLPVGAFNANIVIESNDPINPVKILPVTLNVLVGIDESSMDQISVYPVPANSLLNIKLVDGVRQIRMINMMGQVVHEIGLNGELNKTVDLTGLHKGVYTLQFINTLGEPYHKTIIITE